MDKVTLEREMGWDWISLLDFHLGIEDKIEFSFAPAYSLWLSLDKSSLEVEGISSSKELSLALAPLTLEQEQRIRLLQSLKSIRID